MIKTDSFCEGFACFSRLKISHNRILVHLGNNSQSFDPPQLFLRDNRRADLDPAPSRRHLNVIKTLSPILRVSYKISQCLVRPRTMSPSTQIKVHIRSMAETEVGPGSIRLARCSPPRLSVIKSKRHTASARISRMGTWWHAIAQLVNMNGFIFLVLVSLRSPKLISMGINGIASNAWRRSRMLRRQLLPIIPTGSTR